jgi:chromosome partitioning protein
MNSKGGCGKSTVATNLASYCASRGHATALFDYDRQATSSRWLKVRPGDVAPLHGVAAFQPPPAGVTRAWQMRVPDATRYVVIDTPAANTDIELQDRVAEADIILIPVLPSAIDIQASADFIRDLLLTGRARARHKRLAIIANRTRIRTRSVEKLERFLQSLDIPVVARIRDTQHYVRAAETGLGVHELHDRDAVQDEMHWAETLAWLEQWQTQGVPPADHDRLLLRVNK